MDVQGGGRDWGKSPKDIQKIKKGKTTKKNLRKPSQMWLSHKFLAKRENSASAQEAGVPAFIYYSPTSLSQGLSLGQKREKINDGATV